jgi:hypothetical protein
MKTLIALLFVVFFLNFAHTAESTPPYSQSYFILIKGEAVGSENIVEKVGAKGETTITSNHELFITNGLQTDRMAFTTEMVISKTGSPVSYLYRYTTGNTGDYYELTIKDRIVTRLLSRGGQTSEVIRDFTSDMVIVDHNVYHHYEHLFRKYDMKVAGRQLFANFIPIIGDDIPVAVTYLGDEILNVAAEELHVRNFGVEFVGISTGTFSVDKNGRLVRLTVPSQHLQVLRREFLY